MIMFETLALPASPSSWACRTAILASYSRRAASSSFLALRLSFADTVESCASRCAFVMAATRFSWPHMYRCASSSSSVWSVRAALMETTPCLSFAGPSDGTSSRLPLTTCMSEEDGPPPLPTLPIDVTASQQDRMRVSSQPYPSRNGPTDSSTSSISVSASIPARYSMMSPSIPSTTPSSPPSLRRTEARAPRSSSSEGVDMVTFAWLLWLLDCWTLKSRPTRSQAAQFKLIRQALLNPRQQRD
mmetsp:Transcript_19667/g.44426  ORF Transcript_19667/g.44426 Transcript_19667/m.44426 type:complete len:244 (+) Transcript_19667:1167-1898(+)